MSCAVLTQLSFNNILSVNGQSWLKALSTLTKCYTEKKASEQIPEAEGKEQKPADEKKKNKELAENLKEEARIPRRLKKKPAKLSTRQLIKKVGSTRAKTVMSSRVN